MTSLKIKITKDEVSLEGYNLEQLAEPQQVLRELADRTADFYAMTQGEPMPIEDFIYNESQSEEHLTNCERLAEESINKVRITPLSFLNHINIAIGFDDEATIEDVTLPFVEYGCVLKRQGYGSYKLILTDVYSAEEVAEAIAKDLQALAWNVLPN